MSHGIFTTPFATVYPHYVIKVERNGQDIEHVDEILCWLTGYDVPGLKAELENETDIETFFAKAPHMNPNRRLISGIICGVRVEEIKNPLMQEIRYMDKLIDELAKGKAIERILRT